MATASPIYQSLTCLILLFNVTLSHLKCGHDSFDHVIQRNIHTSRPRETISNNGNKNKRNLQEASSNNIPENNDEWDNMRIAYNTEGLLDGWSDYNFKYWFANDVIPAAIEYLEKVIKVRPIDGNLTLERRCNSWVDEEENKCHHVSSSYASCGGYHDIEDKYFDEIYLCPDGVNCEKIESGGGTAHDVTLYFVGKASSYGCNGVYGFSSFCHTNLYDRPIAGFINLCEQTLLDEGDYFTWEKAVTLVAHEVYHVLGFSSTGFAYFRNNDADRTARSPRVGGDDGNGNYDTNFGFVEHGTTSGLRYNYGSDTIVREYIPGRQKYAAFIVLPTVIDVIRNFYNCTDMIGLELEDFGGADTASSHWEQRILSMEFMIGYISSAAPVSVFSMAVFEDSGWYKMDWDYAAITPYGKGFGCDWYEEKCVLESDGGLKALDDDMYCTSDVKYGCAADYVGKSNCELKEYTDGEIPDAFQYFGGFGTGDEGSIGGVLGYADFCPMFYHYSNGDCRIIESSHVYESFGAEICPNCKCNEMYSSDFDKNYAICYETECARNYLYDDDVVIATAQRDYTDVDYFADYGDYVATRIKISNDGYSRHEYITCWRSESNQFKKTSYYSYYVQCPDFEDICYDKNPWICNGHGMKNTESVSVEDQCFCAHGYIGCDCTLRNTQSNKENTELMEATCVDDDDNSGSGSMPLDEDDLDWDYLGLVNITIQLDARYSMENVLKTLRLWVAINTKVHEDNVWIDSYQPIGSSLMDSLSNDVASVEKSNYSLSIAYYDDQNGNKINDQVLVNDFHYLFNSDSENNANDNEFILYDIYKIKNPTSDSNTLYPLSFTLLLCVFFIFLN